MEDRSPAQNDAESWHPDTEAARPSFLASWLRRRQESFMGKQEHDTSEEEDDDDEESTLPKRFRRFFRRVFKQIVEPVEQGPEATPRLLGLPFSIESVAPAPGPALAETAINTAPEPTEAWPGAEVAPPDVVDATTIQLDKTTPLTHEAYQRPLFERPESMATEMTQQYPEATRTSSEVQQEPTQTVVERKEVQAHAGATMALLGAEFFARRRADRKIERKFASEIKTLGQQVDTGNDAQIRLEKAVTMHAEQKPATSVVERIFPVVQSEQFKPAPERQVSSQERAAVVSHEQAQPHIEHQPQPQTPEHPARAAEHLSKPEVTTRIEQELPEKQVQPRAVLEKVVEAAEHNAPLERAYERRQEIKDEAGAPGAVGGGASAVGEILSRSAPATPPPALSYAEHVARQATQRSGPDDAQLYQMAAANGVRAALAIIVFASIAYLIMR